ncbi:MAG TPA: DinB family protein [Ktedonobacteraceae bacterium]|nr:DinB family protein [Ktedonobacteraceae bacterium]
MWSGLTANEHGEHRTTAFPSFPHITENRSSPHHSRGASEKLHYDRTLTQYVFALSSLDARTRHTPPGTRPAISHVSQNAFFQQLPAAELVSIGTPDCWSAKDHVAHTTFWRQRLARRLQAIIRKEPQPPPDNFEHLNSVIFEEHPYRPWTDILAESDAVYAELIALFD